mmetsp:Transcript_75879/g.180300  ORF Transcript_75879/g.180300 Transcript_75879/m.180300 type:complete len:235 (+) Transcript_75879:81-785(+)
MILYQNRGSSPKTVLCFGSCQQLNCSLLQGLGSLLDDALARIILVLDLLRDLLEELRWQNAQQLPGDVKRGEDVTVLISSLRNEALLELLSELQILVLILTQSLLADDCLHGAGILTDGVVRVQLVTDVGVVHSGHALANTRLHQSTKRWQHIDGWVDLPVVQATVDEHLSLCDVAGEVRDRVGDVIVWHCENWELGDSAVASLDTSCTFIDGRQVGVHVTWVTTATRHLLTSC